MAATGKSTGEASVHAASISRYAKERYLKTMTEDDFRDKVVRPLFARMSFEDGRDLCGPEEEGKDAVFLHRNPLGRRDAWVVQTKRGSLNLSSKANENVVSAETQIRTALGTKVHIPGTTERVYPARAILCASGKINAAARKWICEKLADPRIEFMDADDIIPEIDTRYSEFWWGMDADRFPYLKSLRDSLVRSSDTITLPELSIGADTAAPITDDAYVPLFLYRLAAKVVKVKGQAHKEAKLEQIPVHALLTKPSELLHIAGGAGAGKTTALRRFAYQIAAKSLAEGTQSAIPVLLKCADIAGKEETLHVLAANATVQHTLSGKPAFGPDDLAKGKLLLLIDALDEVGEPMRNGVVEKVLHFHEQFPRCKVILTSRDYQSISSYEGMSKFVRYNLMPIGLRQAEKMLQKLRKDRSLSLEAASEMLRRLHEIHGIQLNPLLVTIFVATADYSRKDIPANITELFKKFTEMMLGRWDQRKGLSQQYQANVKDFLLRKLAFHMHSQKVTRLSLGECSAVFQRELQETGHQADAQVLFDEIVSRSGLLRTEGDTIAFSHALLQEFFAGRGVPTAEFFQRVLQDEWWRHPLTFYFGENPDAHNRITTLIQAVDQSNPIVLYRSAVAIGLAVQACYLSKVRDKAQSMGWVIEALATSKEGFIDAAGKQQPQLGTMPFLGYLLYAKDSIACASLKEKAVEAIRELAKMERTPVQDAQMFWYLMSLIESGSLGEILPLLKGFEPTDARLLLGIYLSCAFIANLRITSAADRETAETICSALSHRTADLRQQVLNDMKSVFLEVRQGKIISLEKHEEPHG